MVNRLDSMMLEESKANVCILCGKTFSQKRYLDRHKNSCATSYLRKDKLPSLPCTVCGKEFRRLSHLKRHQLTHLNIRNFQCSFCPEAFSQKSHLQRHLSAKHRDDAKRSLTTNFLMGQTTLFACIKCPENSVKSFPTRWELRRHQSRVHVTELSCSSCEKEKNRTVTFETYEAWKGHVEYHKGKRPYICQVCWKCFAQKIDLDNHLAAVHEKLGKFQCSVCEKAFPQRTQVDRHLFKNHIRDDELIKFRCRPCTETFGAEKFLIQHLRLHHQFLERILFCKYCNDWFLDKSLLSDHTDLKHFKKLKSGVPLSETLEEEASSSVSDANCEGSGSFVELQLKIKIGDMTGVDTKSLNLSHKLPEELISIFPQLEKLEIEIPGGLAVKDSLVVVNVPVSTKSPFDINKLSNFHCDINYP